MGVTHTKTLTANIFLYALLGLLALLPFHAFATTWLGTIVNNRPQLQSWKEIVVIALGLYTVFWAIRDRSLGRFLLENSLNKLILVYIALHLGLSLIIQPELTANLHGLKINLEFLVLFLAAQAVIWRARPVHIDRKVVDVLIAGGLVVSLFGLAQALILPPDFLTNFGYGPGTINPFLPIADNSGFYRILSTLGGPNQLGQYLILPFVCILYRSFQTKNNWWFALTIPVLACMYFTYSRSAWVGAVLALCVILLGHFDWRKVTLIFSLGLVAIGIVVALFASNSSINTKLSYLVFHGSTPATSVSNNDRILAIRSAVNEVIEQPLGRGPGMAGPASFYLQKHTGVISENYYLQIAIEVGILGLIFFITILVIAGLSLAKLPPGNALALPLLATLIGWSFINLVLHGWADSTSSLIWWGSAGAIIRNTK